MAEIKIEKKKQIWPWILTGLVVAALVVYFVGFRDNNENKAVVADADNTTETNDSDLIAVNENNSTVAEYVNFIRNSNENMTLDHEFTNEALLKLNDATSAMADEVNYDINADMDKVRNLANEITEDPYETSHADKIKKSSEIITNVLQNIQNAHYPSLANDVSDLKSASQSIKTDVLTLDQKSEVKAFLNKAADVLEKMN